MPSIKLIRTHARRNKRCDYARRQEVVASVNQIVISFHHEPWEDEEVKLWLNEYRVIMTKRQSHDLAKRLLCNYKNTTGS